MLTFKTNNHLEFTTPILSKSCARWLAYDCKASVLKFLIKCMLKIIHFERVLLIFTVSTSIDTGIDTGEMPILSIDTETQSILEALLMTWYFVSNIQCKTNTN